jgi:tetratricopeptide (TPR) repeat protein
MLRSARGMLEQGDKHGGVKLLRETVERFPEEVVALVALWDFHRHFGLPEDEAAQLHEILTQHLADPERSLPPGVLRYLIGNPDADERELELLLTAAKARLKDDDVEMLGAIASLQVRLELIEEARKTYGELRELAPSDMLDWQCVLLDVQLERWADAAAGLAPIVAKKDASLTSRLMYIDALSRSGQYDAMVRQIDRLPSDNPLMTELINGVLSDSAWNLRDAGKDAEAEAVFRRILAADPKNPQALAAVLYLYGTEEELRAHSVALEAARADETDPHVLLEQGGNLLAAGDAEQALTLLERASRELPDEEIAWFNLGLAALKLERWEAAERALLHATKINPSRASALQELGRCAEAIEALNRTLELAPDKTEAYYYLYACHAELGNHAAAQEALRRYNAR